MQGITVDAAKQLKSSLDRPEIEDDVCVRLQFESEGAQLKLDKQHEEDKVFEHEGRPVLIVDAATAKQCEGKTLDFSEQRFCFV